MVVMADGIELTHEIDIAQGEPLPFFEKKQDAFLGHLLLNDSFFQQVRSKVKPEWFIDPWCAKVWESIQSFVEQYGRKPTEHELSQSLQWLRVDQAARQRMTAKLGVAKTATQEYGLDVIRSELTLWLRSRIFKTHLEQAYTQHNAAARDKNPEKKFAEAFSWLKRATVEIEQASFEAETTVDFNDIASGAFFDARAVEMSRALVFGCDLVDRKLNPGAPNGALFRGDHTVLLAPTNVGKTTTMISVIAENLRRGRSVLFLTHEGRPTDIKSKLVCAYLERSYGEVFDMSKTPEGQRALGLAVTRIARFLDYIPLNRASLTVEDVLGTIRRQCEKRQSRHGASYDLIVDDYPAKLVTESAGKQWAPRQITEAVYNVFTQIALEQNAHVLSAIQTNREGSKINQHRKGSEERLLSLDDVSESFGALHTATNVISLNRDPLAQARNRMTFHICKSRSSETGWSIVSKTDFGRARTHGSTLQATVYRGVSPLSDTIDDLLVQYAGQAVPDKFYLA